MNTATHTPDASGDHVFTVTASDLVHTNAITALRSDTVTMPGGSTARRDVIEHYGAVAVVALGADNRVALIRQYRHPIGRRLWELPAGLLDVAEEPAVECAQRELMEEADLGAHTWHTLTDIVTSPGILDEAVRIFLAEDLYDRPAPTRTDEEADATPTFIDLDTALEMIHRGEIINAITITGLLLADKARSNRALLKDADADFELRPTHLIRRPRN